MGPIVDRSEERLGPADRAVITARQILLNGLKAPPSSGSPPGVAGTYYDLFAYEQVFQSESGNLQEVVDVAVPPPTLLAGQAANVGRA